MKEMQACILFVDPEAGVFGLPGELEKRGHTVFCSTNHEDAVRILKKTPFDLIILEIDLPLNEEDKSTDGKYGFILLDDILSSNLGEPNKNIPVLVNTRIIESLSLRQLAKWGFAEKNNNLCFKPDRFVVQKVVARLLEHFYPDEVKIIRKAMIDGLIKKYRL